MSSTDGQRSGILNEILKGILRTSAALSYGTTVFPATDTSRQWPPVQAKRVPPLKEWFIERHTFESEITNAYPAMSSSEVKLVVAGTGVGKTTRLPYMLAKTHSVCALVLMPVFTLMVDTLSYLLSQKAFSDVTFERLRKKVVDKPPSGITVYFSTAADFLSMLSSDRKLCQKLKLGFIYLDEQHVPRPDYLFVQYLVALGTFPDTKVFYGTATAAGSADMSMEGGVKRTVLKKPQSNFPSFAKDVKVGDPMHERSVASYGKVLVFLADDVEIASWMQYYEDNDIPVFAYGYGASKSEMPKVRSFLAANDLGVVLTTSMLEVSVTLDISCVICTGRTTVLQFDPANSSVYLKKTTVTQKQQTQRIGRVSRMYPGTAIYADVEFRNETELPMEQSVYLYLWAKKFNVSIRSEAVSLWADSFSDLTQIATSLLLHSQIPPVLMYAYLAHDGYFEGWAKICKRLMYTEVGQESADQCEGMSSWLELSTGAQPYLRQPEMFRVRVKPPAEWYPLFHWMYVEYMQENPYSQRLLDNRSYAPTEVTTVRSEAPVKRSGTMSQLGVPETPSFPQSRRKPQKEKTPEQVRKLRSVLDNQSAFYSNVAGQDFALPEERRPLSAVQEVPESTKNESVRQWVKQVQPQPQENPESPSRTTVKQYKITRKADSKEVGAVLVRSQSSNSSDEHDFLDLVRIDPMKRMFEKYYPLDNAILKEFMVKQACGSKDRQRVHDLLTGKCNFSSLERTFESRKDKQASYFMSIIREHNELVMELAQRNAQSITRKRFYHRDLDGLLDNITEQIVSRVKLLVMCEKENYFVGIDRRTKHSLRTPGSLRTPLSGSFFHRRSFSLDQNKAEFSLLSGDERVAEKVREISEQCLLLKSVDEEGVVYTAAHMWLSTDLIYAVTHSFCDQWDGEISLPHDASEIVSRRGELIQFRAKVPSEYRITISSLTSGMDIYVLATTVEGSLDVKAHGPYSVYTVGDTWHFDSDFHHGYSGALCVDMLTGNAVGMYVGTFMMIQGKMHGTLVSF